MDEQFLDSFSWGSGCQLYFWSRSMWLFLIASFAINGLNSFYEQTVSDLTWDTMTNAQALEQLVYSLILLALSLTVMIWAGKVARRRRWIIQNWVNFAQYRNDEKIWNVLGIIGWVINAVALFLALGFMMLIGILGGLMGWGGQS